MFCFSNKKLKGKWRSKTCTWGFVKIHDLFTLHWQFEAIFPAYFLSERGNKATKPVLFHNISSFKAPRQAKGN